MMLGLLAAADPNANLPLLLSAIALIVGPGGVLVIFLQNRGKKINTPADDNEASRVAKEWYRDMLADAKAEREELRKTIEDLRDEKVEASKAITRLEGLLTKKDDRIIELERRRDANVAKLQAGLVLTLGDILGSDPTSHDNDPETT